MRLSGLFSILGVLAVLAGPASAQDIWALNSMGASCRISFLPEPVDAGINAVVQHDNCPGAFADLTGYSMSNGDGTVMFYSTAYGLTQVGRADKERDGYYVGMSGDGVPFDLIFTGQQQQTMAPVAPQPQNCLSYYGGGCAQGHDVGPPPFANGMSSLETLVDMNVRFLPGTNSQIVGKAPKGWCVNVSQCRTQFDNTLWCETRVGNFTGWILKQDAQYVYSRNLCG